MKADKTKNIRLLKTARGQIDGIIRMMEDDRYCIDIVNQILAAQAILKKVNSDVLHAHLEHCVTDTLNSGDPDEVAAKVQEIMKVLDQLSGK